MQADKIEEGDTVITESGTKYTVEKVPPWTKTIKEKTIDYTDKLKVRVPETVVTTVLPLDRVDEVRE